MNSLNQIEFKYYLALSCVIFFGFLFSSTTVAQSDRDRNMPDVPKSADVVNFDGTDASYVETREMIGTKPAPSQSKNNPIIAPSAAKKENPLFKQGSDKDQIKKESMSTLSFNIFLYIVDKFRED